MKLGYLAIFGTVVITAKGSPLDYPPLEGFRRSLTDYGFNIAVGKDASQSSTWKPHFPAGLAVDGNKVQEAGGGGFAHTRPLPGSWWLVDLGWVYPISAVKLYNRQDQWGARLKNFNVELLDSSDGQVALKQGLKAKSWRIMAIDDNLVRNGIWDVNELEFYDNFDCTNKVTGGTAISGGHYTGRDINDVKASNAFDSVDSTIWGGRADPEDPEGLLWVGMEFDDAVAIKCVAFLDGVFVGWGVAGNGATTVEIQLKDESSGDWNTLEVGSNLTPQTRDEIPIGSNIPLDLPDNSPSTLLPLGEFTFEFENIAARKVLVKLDDDYSEPLQLIEVEVFSPIYDLDFDHWEINTGNASIVEDEGPRIQLEFNISSRDHSTQVLQDDCKTNFTGVAEGSIYFVNTPLTSSGEFLQYNTSIKIDHTAFVNEGTYWNRISDTLGFMEVCVLTELYLDETEPKETVYFVENVINVTIDTDGNFEVSDINVTRTGPEESEVAVDFSTYLDAYQCTPENLADENTQTYSQGSVLVVCVKGDGDIVEVENIKQLSVNQGSNAPFEYISETNGYNEAIVRVECQDDNSNRICSAQVRLLGRFFTSDNPENLQVTGSVALSFPNNRQRRLSYPKLVPGQYNDFKNSRYLQENSDTGAFNIDAELEKIDDSVNSQSILSGNVLYHLSSFVLCYVLSLVWYIA